MSTNDDRAPRRAYRLFSRRVGLILPHIVLAFAITACGGGDPEDLGDDRKAVPAEPAASEAL